MQMRQMVTMQIVKEQIRYLRNEISEIRRISPVGEILDSQSGGRAEAKMDSSGQIAQEESLRTAPLDVNSQHIVVASYNIASVESGNTPPTVMVDRRVKIAKYCSIVPTSTEIARKYRVSNNDNNFDNLDMLDKALRASNLLSLVNGSRSKSTVTNLNS